MYAADVGGSGPGGVLSDEEMARALQRQFDEEAAMIEAEERLRDMVSTHAHSHTRTHIHTHTHTHTHIHALLRNIEATLCMCVRCRGGSV